ncbi:nuclear transport factor 2 family protein [Streptomyces sp. WAC07149]|uniref:nuclear transport factor 2 family protein n=1 Tax=Streptomyces sp. WAC07149 TaxID=2487425 RepID=UPI000F7A4DB8|nr:nuclear transport factor 2 family protein [Streptomyces sp. WAC07149]RST06964.1 nuclear transport factor 2 family protein [Streptomyces sp. WAC07149]
MSINDGLVERYLAVWNEPDADRRRKEVAEIWAEDGLYANTGREFHGHEGILEAVTEAYDEFVAQGFAFRLHAHAENHNTARITWNMAPRSGGDVAARGTQYLVFAEDGRIRTDHQFPEEI